GLLTQVLELGGRRWRRIGRCGARGLGRWRAAQTDVADVEIFLEAIELQEVGEFESADVAAAGADFLLEVSDDALEILGAEACTEELVPESLPVKAQRKLLTCELAIKLVSGSQGGKGVGIHEEKCFCLKRR